MTRDRPVAWCWCQGIGTLLRRGLPAFVILEHMRAVCSRRRSGQTNILPSKARIRTIGNLQRLQHH
jgi:hypothetical protein